MTPFLSKTSLSKSFCSLRSGFRRAIYDASKFFLVLAFFDIKQKRCIKRIHLVTDDGLYDRKAFYKVEIVFIHPLSKLVIEESGSDAIISDLVPRKGYLNAKVKSVNNMLRDYCRNCTLNFLKHDNINAKT